MKLIGIVGQPGSGKDVAAKYIAKGFGFKHISSGDVLRRYINDNKLGGMDRKNLQHIVTKLRAQNGNGVLVKLILNEIKPESNVIVSGLRNPDEITLINKAGGKIIAIDADVENRYKRTRMRKREGDTVSLDEFIKLEQNENQGGTWDIGKSISMADIKITNNFGYKEFFNDLDKSMSQLGFSKQ